tara:strand:+ start:272 stop:445 length:174 start_codon:yes stop_codon:yes gene_type:complete
MCTLLKKDNPSHILKRSPTNLVGLFYIYQKMIKNILTANIVNAHQLPLAISWSFFID